MYIPKSPRFRVGIELLEKVEESGGVRILFIVRLIKIVLARPLKLTLMKEIRSGPG